MHRTGQEPGTTTSSRAAGSASTPRRDLGHYTQLAHALEPTHEKSLPAAIRALRLWQSMAVLFLFDTNERLIEKHAEPHAPRWPTTTWPWIQEAERDTDQFRAELERYLAHHYVPLVAEVAGLDPDTAAGVEAAPVEGGGWRAVMLFANGRWIEDTARHFPSVRQAFSSVRPKANVGFSIVEPRAHIRPHKDPNRGALRFQLPVIVPGAPGECRIRVGDETIAWTEGEALVFDLSVTHEVWNPTARPRVLLMAEIGLPLPRLLSACNRLAQHTYRWHPSYRRMPRRVTQLATSLRRPGATP